MVDHGVCDVGERLQLIGAEQIDHVTANAAEMMGSSGGNGAEAGTSQDHNGAPRIVIGVHAPNQATLFHPQDLMGETAL
jgi:hypothetical protein